MKKYILSFFIVLCCMVSFAHQPDFSTIMLVEKENNVWVLQISSSLTAFQQEVRTHFSETPYKTPEEFKEMVLEHIRGNFYIICNGNIPINLTNGMVKLGHETKVVFEINGFAKEIQTIKVENKIFNDIYKNRSSLIVLKEDFVKKQFNLDVSNNHSVFLRASGNEFIEKEVNNASIFSWNVVLIILILMGLVLLYINMLAIIKKNRLNLLKKQTV